MFSVLEEKKIPYEIIASQVCGKSDHSVTEIEPSELDAIEQKTADSSLVITGIACEKWPKLHKRLRQNHPEIKQACHYDNPEPFVPGGYSETAEKVIEEVEKVFFANSQLATLGTENREEKSIDLSQKEVHAIGYYTCNEAMQIRELRENNERRETSFEVWKVLTKGRSTSTSVEQMPSITRRHFPISSISY